MTASQFPPHKPLKNRLLLASLLGSLGDLGGTALALLNSLNNTDSNSLAHILNKQSQFCAKWIVGVFRKGWGTLMLKARGGADVGEGSGKRRSEGVNLRGQRNGREEDSR